MIKIINNNAIKQSGTEMPSQLAIGERKKSIIY